MMFSTSDTVEILVNTTGTTSALSDVRQWNITDGSTGGDILLEEQDKFTILARPTAALSANEEFNLEIRPSIGAAFGLKRTISAKINSVNLLY